MTPSVDEIRAWVVARVSGLTQLPVAEIDTQEPFSRYGLDSVAVILLASDLEKWLNYRFSENPLAECPNIESLARFLSEAVGKKTAG